MYCIYNMTKSISATYLIKTQFSLKTLDCGMAILHVNTEKRWNLQIIQIQYSHIL